MRVAAVDFAGSRRSLAPIVVVREHWHAVEAHGDRARRGHAGDARERLREVVDAGLIRRRDQRDLVDSQELRGRAHATRGRATRRQRDGTEVVSVPGLVPGLSRRPHHQELVGAVGRLDARVGLERRTRRRAREAARRLGALLTGHRRHQRREVGRIVVERAVLVARGHACFRRARAQGVAGGGRRHDRRRAAQAASESDEDQPHCAPPEDRRPKNHSAS